jgi:hypothetical protein
MACSRANFTFIYIAYVTNQSEAPCLGFYSLQTAIIHRIFSGCPVFFMGMHDLYIYLFIYSENGGSEILRNVGTLLRHSQNTNIHTVTVVEVLHLIPSLSAVMLRSGTIFVIDSPHVNTSPVFWAVMPCRLVRRCTPVYLSTPHNVREY